MVTVTFGTTTKPAASKVLSEFFKDNANYEGDLYIGYPVIGTAYGPFPIDATYVSKKHGLVIFNLIENKDIENYEEFQDESFNKMEAKLKNYKTLTKKKGLMVKINIITFAPAFKGEDSIEGEYPLCNAENLDLILSKFSWDENDCYNDLLSVLQVISTIKKSKRKRMTKNPDSKGTKLRLLEDSIANLDSQQSRAVIETVEGVQRIRGLAGSGKTIILALKAAYLHVQHPDWKIAVTFNTRSLKAQFKQLINTFYIEQANDEPNWDNLHIIQAWGSPGGGENNGIYFSFCSNQENSDYLDFTAARSKYGYEQAFHGACKLALSQISNPSPIYDAILVDEAQDFSPAFLKICFELLKNPKRLVYAYDELQNLGSESLPAPEILFDKYKNGSPKVVFHYDENGVSKQDIVLKICYRNSKPTLVTAHSLGFGIYRKKDPKIDTGLVQMFEQKELWKEIGYVEEKGILEFGEHVKLARSPESSPLFLEQHSDVDDLIKFQQFNSVEEMNDWVAENILINLKEDELLSDDIIVINPDPLKTRDAVAPIRAKLFKNGANSHTTGISSSRDEFFDAENKSIAFTGIYRAKGNEAAMVYVINAQDCFKSNNRNLSKIRNRLFTAITRSKAWVRVVGVGEDMDELIQEYQQVKMNNFCLDFNYPTQEQLEYLNIINRDMSNGEKQNINAKNRSLVKLVEDFEKGILLPEDIDDSTVSKLLNFLSKRKEG